MTELLIAFFGGVSAHQTERFIDRFPHPWGMFCRYVVGILAVFVFYIVALRRLNPLAWRDGALAFLLSAVGVGAGVVAAHFGDHLVIE
jgi:hypothetical protein